jgi:hypothetical protein
VSPDACDESEFNAASRDVPGKSAVKGLLRKSMLISLFSAQRSV